MARISIKAQVQAISAKVTALTMLVEALWVDYLAEDSDPAAIGQAMVERLLETERKMRNEVGENPFALQISEAVSSLIDRAVARAVLQRSKKRR